MPEPHVSLVLAGGVALGAYQAGALATLLDAGGPVPDTVAGVSIGAVNAVLFAGNPPERRVAALSAFWDAAAIAPFGFGWPRPAGETETWRHAVNWAHVLGTRLFGRSGLFRPRLPSLRDEPAASLYDLGPLRRRLAEHVDFDRLNGGPLRVVVGVTDLETGRPVAFDTGAGTAISPDHVLASCGFIPDFPPVEIDSRLYGDGCLSANAPIGAAMAAAPDDRDALCLLIDLFAPEGPRPRGIEAAASRRWDLVFGNQTRSTVEAVLRERELRRRSAGPDAAAVRGLTLVHLCHEPAAYEAGPERPFDFSRASLEDRRAAGARDMSEALRVLADGPHGPGDVYRRIRPPSTLVVSAG